jgi:hypothetical protein
VSYCTIWLKTLNLALMEGTPQYIHFFFLSWFLLLFYFPILLLCFLFRDKKKKKKKKKVFQFKFGGVL